MALLVLRRVGLCVGQNQMCHLCGWLKLFLKNVRWEKIKIQKRWLLGRLSECSLFLSLFSVSLCLSFVLCSFFRLAGNVLRLCEGGEIEARMFKLALKPHFCKTAVSSCSYFLFSFFFNSAIVNTTSLFLCIILWQFEQTTVKSVEGFVSTLISLALLIGFMW